MKAQYSIYLLSAIMLYMGLTHVGALLFGIGSLARLCAEFNLCGVWRRAHTVPTSMGKTQTLSARIDAGMRGGDDI